MTVLTIIWLLFDYYLVNFYLLFGPLFGPLFDPLFDWNNWFSRYFSWGIWLIFDDFFWWLFYQLLHIIWTINLLVSRYYLRSFVYSIFSSYKALLTGTASQRQPAHLHPLRRASTACVNLSGNQSIWHLLVNLGIMLWWIFARLPGD